MNNNIFSTDSFILASFLMTESIPLISVDKTDRKRVLFQFEESDKRQEKTSDFLSYKALVEPHRFFSSQKDLKQMIHS